ncbi:hypothetical protein FACS189451_08320 [Bacteroidia bacterium]|nr:hypothetical protein FACS189446_2790 [Bacteroidia bacterium]GHT62876.1 hypothetical protein FACS189451_08320 [Bacteroidia bacterium]
MLIASALLWISCDNNSEIDIVEDNAFFSNVNEAYLQNIEPVINLFLSRLDKNLTDSVKLLKTAEYLNSYSCINDAKVTCNACISPSMGQTPHLKKSEIFFNFFENGIKKHYVLDIWNDEVLRVAEFHKQFEPETVIVQTKGYYIIDSVFAWINRLGFDVTEIQCEAYQSKLPPDSLQYVLNKLNEKPYTHQDGWKITGYLHYQTQEITIFPYLFNMQNKEYQADWLSTMIDYQLVETIGSGLYDGTIIHFKVPEGTEPDWVEKFLSLDFVQWAETNNYGHIIFW